MIYGAYGYTGRRIAEEAVRRGHRPLLSGRSADKLTPVAERLGVDMAVLDLRDEDRLQSTLAEVRLVLNAAGPFIHTAHPIVQACLKTETNYLDVSGEAMVLEWILALDQQAQEREVAIIPGVGFNVLASDSLARYVTERLDSPTHLEIATWWTANGMSPGSTKTMIESFPSGTMARREGQLTRISARDGRRQQRFLDGVKTILPVTYGDLVTAYGTTNTPNITTYTALTEQAANAYLLLEPVFRHLFGAEFIRRLANKWVEITASRSEHHQPEPESSEVWALAQNEEGAEEQAWLETVESYLFTARAVVRSVEKLFSEHQVGALTPALAFGADFVLEIPGTKRFDRLEAF